MEALATEGGGETGELVWCPVANGVGCGGEWCGRSRVGGKEGRGVCGTCKEGAVSIDAALGSLTAFVKELRI